MFSCCVEDKGGDTSLSCAHPMVHRTSCELAPSVYSIVGSPGYTTMAENLLAFDEIGGLPRSLQLSRLDEGQGIEGTFRLHGANGMTHAERSTTKPSLGGLKREKCLMTITMIQYHVSPLA